jgi:hypothetical protein
MPAAAQDCKRPSQLHSSLHMLRLQQLQCLPVYVSVLPGFVIRFEAIAHVGCVVHVAEVAAVAEAVSMHWALLMPQVVHQDCVPGSAGHFGSLALRLCQLCTCQKGQLLSCITGRCMLLSGGYCVESFCSILQTLCSCADISSGCHTSLARSASKSQQKVSRAMRCSTCSCQCPCTCTAIAQPLPCATTARCTCCTADTTQPTVVTYLDS